MSRGGEKDHAVVTENQWYDAWVKQHIEDLTGKVAIVTGANSGTGFWAASALAGKGCTVVLACRNPTKAKGAKDEILETYPHAKVDVTMVLDNMDLQSVRDFARQFNEKYDRLDLLLNNAGIMAQPLIKSKDGYDIQFQTNHLSHFLLTKLLWPKIVATPGQSRIVQHSSAAHLFGNFDPTQMEYPPYNWGWFGWIFFLVRIVMPLMGMSPVHNWIRYGMSKLCNLLFMKELNKKIKEEGLGNKVMSVACHPGSSNTNLRVVAGDAAPKFNGGQQSAADGSLPLLMAAVGKGIKGGDYTGPKNFMRGPPVLADILGYGNDLTLAAKLWDYSEKCMQDKFDL